MTERFAPIPPPTRPLPVTMYQGRPLANPDEDVNDQGLRFDIETLIDRRRALQLFGYAGLSAGVVALAACAPSAVASPTASAGAAATTGATCAVIPEETAGPFPGDGSNGPNVLTESGVVRSDIRSSFGEFSGTATGRAADRQADHPGQRQRLLAVRRRRGLRLALRPGGALLALLRRAPRTRTTCAASRRPTTTAWSPSRASSRPATAAAGRTSTSRSTRV